MEARIEEAILELPQFFADVARFINASTQGGVSRSEDRRAYTAQTRRYHYVLECDPLSLAGFHASEKSA
jgi:hypothetical protein